MTLGPVTCHWCFFGDAALEQAQLFQEEAGLAGRWVLLPLGNSSPWHFSLQLLPAARPQRGHCGEALDVQGWGGCSGPVGMLGRLKAVSLAGILRYRVDFQGMEYQGGDDEFFDLDDY